jgi:hypothetical protein
MRDAGYETHVICSDARQINNSHKLEEIIDDVYVHRLPLIRKKTSLLRYIYDYASFFLLASLRVSWLHLKHPFQFIQVNTMPDFLVFAAFLPKLLGVKVSVMMQEPVPELWYTLRNKDAPSIIYWMEQAALSYADKAFTVTQQLKDTFVS